MQSNRIDTVQVFKCRNELSLKRWKKVIKAKNATTLDIIMLFKLDKIS